MQLFGSMVDLRKLKGFGNAVVYLCRKGEYNENV